MYVCRTLERTVVDPSGWWQRTPAPSLLAEPSSPRQMSGRSGGGRERTVSEGEEGEEVRPTARPIERVFHTYLAAAADLASTSCWC